MVDKAQRSRGLYTPELEHDACGICFVAHLKIASLIRWSLKHWTCSLAWNTVAVRIVTLAAETVRVFCC